MKRIKGFGDFIAERKTVGILYHFTDLMSLEGILEENRMVSSALYDYISMTRNYRLGSSNSWKSHKKNIRLTFDGDAMSNRFRFAPFLYDPEKDPLFGNPLDKGIDSRRKAYGDEREERIMSREIKNVKQYILQVDILERIGKPDPRDKKRHEEEDQIIEKLKADNPSIDFNIVTSLSPYHWGSPSHKVAA